MTQGILGLVMVILTGVIMLMILLTIFKYKQNWKLDLAIAVNALVLAVLYYFINSMSHWWCVMSLMVAVYWFAKACYKKIADHGKEAEKKE